MYAAYGDKMSSYRNLAYPFFGSWRTTSRIGKTRKRKPRQVLGVTPTFTRHEYTYNVLKVVVLLKVALSKGSFPSPLLLVGGQGFWTASWDNFDCNRSCMKMMNEWMTLTFLTRMLRELPCLTFTPDRHVLDCLGVFVLLLLLRHWTLMS